MRGKAIASERYLTLIPPKIMLNCPFSARTYHSIAEPNGRPDVADLLWSFMT